jgi:hypothetical protein
MIELIPKIKDTNDLIFDFSRVDPDRALVLKSADEITVVDDKTAEAAIRIANDLRDFRRRVTAILFGPIIANWKFGLEAAKKMAADWLRPIEAKEIELSARAESYMVKRRQEREADERRARDEAIAAQRRIEDDNLDRAAKLENEGRPDLARRVLDAPIPKPAFLATAPPVPIPPKTIAGAGTRRTWRWRIVDMAAVPAEFKMTVIADSKVDVIFRRDRENMRIPGIEVYPEETLVRR